MKDGIHPNYREVVFMDMSNNFQFVTRSCANTKKLSNLMMAANCHCLNWILQANRTHSIQALKNLLTTWAAEWNASATVLGRPVRQLLKRTANQYNQGSTGNRAAFFYSYDT